MAGQIDSGSVQSHEMMKGGSSEGGRPFLRIGLVVTLSLATVWALFGWFLRREPGYRGQTLLEWVQQVGGPGDQSKAQAAIRAIGAQKAVPCLLKEVRRDSLREAMAPVRTRLPTAVNESLPPSDNDLILNKIPVALSILGPAALPDLIKATQDKDLMVQQTAIWSINLMGPAAESALPVLIRILGETNGLNGLAALAIGRMGPARTQAIPALVAALPVTRFEAARTLGEMGREAEGAVPALKTMLDTPQENSRLQAATALWRITHDTNLVDRVIPELGKRQGYTTYKGFLNLLGEMGPAAKPAVPEILRTMTRWGTEMSRPVRPVLEKIDPEAASLFDKSGIAVN